MYFINCKLYTVNSYIVHGRREREAAKNKPGAISYSYLDRHIWCFNESGVEHWTNVQSE